jgi:hypothetical protein
MGVEIRFVQPYQPPFAPNFSYFLVLQESLCALFADLALPHPDNAVFSLGWEVRRVMHMWQSSGIAVN